MPPTVATHRHLLDVAGLNWAELSSYLTTADAARRILATPAGRADLLKGVNVTTLFYESSTRTRISFEAAAKRLSADVITFSAKGSSVSKGESPAGKPVETAATGIPLPSRARTAVSTSAIEASTSGAKVRTRVGAGAIPPVATS